MISDLHSHITLQRSDARSMGGKIFLWASIAFMVGIGALIVGIIEIVELYERLRYEYAMDRLIIPKLLDDREVMTAITSALAAATTFVALAWLLGRLAGSAIQIKRRGFGWVGPLTMLLPSIMGSFVGLLMFAMQDNGMMRRMQRDLLENMVLPWAVCSVVVFLAAAIIGALAGLYVRQQGRLFTDRKQAAAMGLADVSEDALPGHLTDRAARSLGMKVFVVGAAMLSFVRVGTSMLLAMPGYKHQYHADSLLPIVLAHLLFVALAAWAGRSAGVAILKRGSYFGVVGAGYLVVPTVLSAIAFRALLYLFRSGAFYYTADRPLDYFVYPTLENVLFMFVEATLLGIFAGMVLRHLGQWKAESLAEIGA